MSTTVPSHIQTNHGNMSGTPAQRERAAALRRFNLFFVYLPTALLLLIVLVMMGLLVWFTIGGSGDEYRRMVVSGTADIFTILFIMPLTLMCAILPLGVTGLLIYGRRQKWAPLQRIQHIFWKAEDTVRTVEAKTDEIVPQVARPVIWLHSMVAYIKTFLYHLKHILTWS
jgi:hypothetical protein